MEGIKKNKGGPAEEGYAATLAKFEKVCMKVRADCANSAKRMLTSKGVHEPSEAFSAARVTKRHPS